MLKGQESTEGFPSPVGLYCFLKWNRIKSTESKLVLLISTIGLCLEGYLAGKGYLNGLFG